MEASTSSSVKAPLFVAAVRFDNDHVLVAVLSDLNRCLEREDRRRLMFGSDYVRVERKLDFCGLYFSLSFWFDVHFSMM